MRLRRRPRLGCWWGEFRRWACTGTSLMVRYPYNMQCLKVLRLARTVLVGSPFGLLLHCPCDISSSRGGGAVCCSGDGDGGGGGEDCFVAFSLQPLPCAAHPRPPRRAASIRKLFLALHAFAVLGALGAAAQCSSRKAAASSRSPIARAPTTRRPSISLATPLATLPCTFACFALIIVTLHTPTHQFNIRASVLRYQIKSMHHLRVTTTHFNPLSAQPSPAQPSPA